MSQQWKDAEDGARKMYQFPDVSSFGLGGDSAGTGWEGHFVVRLGRLG